MKFGVPWSVKGIRPEARETAREAARLSGMSLGEWLNSVILQQAEDDDMQAHVHDDDGGYAEDLSSVHQRLDDLTRRIEQFTRTAPAAQAPKGQKRARNESEQIAQLIARLDRRLDQFAHAPQPMAQPIAPQMPPQMAPHLVPSYPPMPQQMAAPPMVPSMAPSMAPPLPPHAMPPMAPYQPAPPPLPPLPNIQIPPALDRAIAEIAARQRALNDAPASPPPAPVQAFAPPQQRRPRPQAEPMPEPEPEPAYAPPPAPVFAPVPTQDLSGLEDQLRRITDQIETLRRPGVEEAINALRGELGDIGRALHEAMPRREIDTIEKQIQGLTQRIAEGRQAGVDNSALGGIEHGLAEVRDVLRGLTPAESLVGFHDAVNALAHKIDLIVAQKNPETLHQLERAITTLRDMATHVASDEAVSSLAAQVQMLGDKVERMALGTGAGDALNHLEHRIDALADALAQRAQQGTTIPPRLEALVQSLTDKIEQIQQTRGDNVAVDHLEDRIVRLVERLDASDSRLGHLEAIERGLGDLLVHMQDMREAREQAPPPVENTAGVDALKHDIARTQYALDAVNGTLGHVVDRLTMIEKEFKNGGRAQALPEHETLELTQPVGRIAARAVPQAQEAPPRMPPVAAFQMPMPEQAPMPAPAPVVAAPPPPPPQLVMAPAPRRMPPAGHTPIDPELPPDQPLEPGSGPPRIRAGVRIAHAEAALGNARPAPAAGAKSSFIAAARRAAQAAVQEASARMPRVGTEAPAADDGREPSPSRRGTMMKRMKSLFIAASIVAIVVGSVQFMGSLVYHAPVTQQAPKPKLSEAAPDTTEADADDAQDTTDSPATNPLTPAAPATTQSINPQTISPATPRSANQGALGLPSSLLAPPMLMSPAAQNKGDVTGSIPRSGRDAAAATMMPAPMLGGLPIAIGSARLRDAAAGGDANAAYEIAARFAEGRGVPASLEDAARWYERAAGKGLTMAQFRYASMLEKGQGVKKDLNAARRLYLAAAAKGNAKAMHNLAVLYAEGIDGKPDYATAAQWFRKAAQYGIADSQYNLGVLTARGLGTEKSYPDSYKWFALAAAHGDKEAGRKRDEVAGQMDSGALAAAQQAVQAFVPAPQPQEATAVAPPAGGWDDAAVPAAPRGKARNGAPLTLGAFNVGKR
jgi:localization factor PodJL